MSEIPLTTRIEVVGVEESRATLSEYLSLIRQFPENAAIMGYQMRKQYENIYQERRGLQLLRAEWRNQHATLVESSRLMREVGTIGRELMQMWQAYTVGMIRIERAQRDVKDATEDLAFWQAQYNEYVQTFGTSSVYAQDAYKRMKKAADDLKEAQQKAKQAQDEMKFGWISMGLAAVGVAGNIIDVVYHMHVLRGVLAATSAEAGLVGATGAASIGFAGLAATFTQVFTPAALSLLSVLGGILAFFFQVQGVGMSVEENIKMQSISWIYSSETMSEYLRGAKELGWSVEDLNALYMEMLKWVYMSNAELSAQATILGYSDKQIQEMIANLKKIREEFGLTTDSLVKLGDTAYGGSVFPEMVKWSDKTAQSIMALSKEFDEIEMPNVKGSLSANERRATIRDVEITNYNTIHNDMDYERAGERMYKRLMKKLENAY